MDAIRSSRSLDRSTWLPRALSAALFYIFRFHTMRSVLIHVNPDTTDRVLRGAACMHALRRCDRELEGQIERRKSNNSASVWEWIKNRMIVARGVLFVVRSSCAVYLSLFAPFLFPILIFFFLLMILGFLYLWPPLLLMPLALNLSLDLRACLALSSAADW